MLVMVVFFIAFRWIHLSTPLIRLFLLVLILLLMPTLNFLPVWFALSLLRTLKATSYMAVGFYVAKYVNKKSDMDLAAKGLGAKEWNNSLKTKLSLLPK